MKSFIILPVLKIWSSDSQWFSTCGGGGGCCPQGAIGHGLEKFLTVTTARRGWQPWPLVGRDQQCCWACCSPQVSPMQQRVVWPKIPVVRSPGLDATEPARDLKDHGSLKRKDDFEETVAHRAPLSRTPKDSCTLPPPNQRKNWSRIFCSFFLIIDLSTKSHNLIRQRRNAFLLE